MVVSHPGEYLDVLCYARSCITLAFICRNKLQAALVHARKATRTPCIKVPISELGDDGGVCFLSPLNVSYSQLVASGLLVCMHCLRLDTTKIVTYYDVMANHRHNHPETKAAMPPDYKVPTQAEWTTELKGQKIQVMTERKNPRARRSESAAESMDGSEGSRSRGGEIFTTLACK